MGEHALPTASDNCPPCAVHRATSPSLPCSLGLVWTPGPKAANSFYSEVHRAQGHTAGKWRCQDLKLCVFDSSPDLSCVAILRCPFSLILGNLELENQETNSVQKLKSFQVTLRKVGWAAAMGPMWAEVWAVSWCQQESGARRTERGQTPEEMQPMCRRALSRPVPSQERHFAVILHLCSVRLFYFRWCELEGILKIYLNSYVYF